jgi:hypothetical protein
LTSTVSPAFRCARWRSAAHVVQAVGQHDAAFRHDGHAFGHAALGRFGQHEIDALAGERADTVDAGHQRIGVVGAVVAAGGTAARERAQRGGAHVDDELIGARRGFGEVAVDGRGAGLGDDGCFHDFSLRMELALL